jgi:hypothetical protein
MIRILELGTSSSSFVDMLQTGIEIYSNEAAFRTVESYGSYLASRVSICLLCMCCPFDFVGLVLGARFMIYDSLSVKCEVQHCNSAYST